MIAIGRQSPLADQSETDYSGFGPINGGHPKRKIELVQEFAAKRTKSVAIALWLCLIAVKTPPVNYFHSQFVVFD